MEVHDFVVDESMVENNLEDDDGVEDAHENVLNTREICIIHSTHDANESMIQENTTANQEEHDHAAEHDIEMGTCATGQHDYDANNDCICVLENENTATTTNDKDEHHNVSTMSNATGLHVETGAPGYIKLRTASGKCTVLSCCAVCLCMYKKGEMIVWSSNVKCQHVFHNECVMEWLTKMQNGTPCPCCHQQFTDLDLKKKRK